MKKQFLPFLVIVATATATATAEPLATARSLAATDFKGWTYGRGAKKTDCVGFLQAVATKEYGEKASARPIADIIAIRTSWAGDAAKTDKAVTDGDPAIEGIVSALVDKLAVATRVAPATALPGDYIQYWMYSKSTGHWFGHSGIVSRSWKDAENKTRVAVFGFHESLPDAGGTENDFKTAESGVRGVGLSMDGPNRKIFLARAK